MATYTKPLKTLTITVSGISIGSSIASSVTIADTATNAKASAALAEFEAGQTMHLVGATSEGETISDLRIPFHAVLAVSVTVATESVTKPDAVCDETSGE